MSLLLTAALGRPCVSALGLRSPHAVPLARVPPLAATSARTPCRRRTSPTVSAKASEEGVAAVGSDLNWSHVARDIKQRVAAVASKEGRMDQLQAWLSETRLSCDLDIEQEGQTEIVAEQEAVYQNLSGMDLDVKRWLSNPDEDAETDSKMAGVLTLRLLQAYHAESGEAFDDESDDAYWRLQGFLPGALVEALDHDTLRRMIKAYVAMPFSGV